MSNKVDILFFGSLRDKLGINSDSLKLDKPLSVGQIREIMLAKSEKWQKFDSELVILTALNHEMVKDEALVNNGDELAFIPPVTGG